MLCSLAARCVDGIGLMDGFDSFFQATTTEDLEFLRNQIITVEVNMARLYNYDVLRRRKAEEAKKIKEESKAGASS